MKIKSLVTAVFLAAILVTTGACTGAAAQDDDKPEQNANEISITSPDEFVQTPQIKKQIEISKGETLTITLISNSTTGYVWNETATISDTSVLQQTSHQNIAPKSSALGAPGKEQWKLNALKDGTATVHLEYGRPWVGGEKATWTVDVTVTVE